MIHYIIYSKNRAAQLDLLLQSIDRFAPLIKVDVIYLATSDEFAKGYQYLQTHYEYSCVMGIYEQTNFKINALCLLQKTKTSLIGFLTDDTVLYATIPYTDDYLWNLMQQNQCNSFSLRNGYNTEEQCHYYSCYNKLITNWEQGELIMWDASQYSYGTDFGRPISIDGNFFNRTIMMSMLRSEQWNDPRSLDGINPWPLGKNVMAFRHSVAVNLPLNLACNGYADNWGRFRSYSLEDLNTQFLQKQRLDLDQMDFSNIWSSHQELELHFKPC